jgi:hypothetical protein
MFASQKLLQERDAKKKREAAAERQRRYTARKLLAARKSSDDIFRFWLERIHKERSLSVADFISLEEFFRLSRLDPVNLDRVKSIETTRVFRNGESFEVVRPKYFLGE